jgi:2-iminobutanoate/2-iminopropanoate deaminase
MMEEIFVTERNGACRDELQWLASSGDISHVRFTAFDGAAPECRCTHHLHFIRGTPIMIIRFLAAVALVLIPGHTLFSVSVGAAEFIQGTARTKARAYSPAVITEGGRIVWLAGMGGTTDADGKPIPDFAGQTRRAFQNIDATLKQAGGTLADVVTMTVFIRNQSDGDEFVKIRGEVFKSGFPASALITAKDFAVPQLLVEIQAVAVIGERN